MFTMGIIAIESILLAAVYPDTTLEPKEFTRDCMKTSPKETIDCCIMVGTAIRLIFFKIEESNLLKTLNSFMEISYPSLFLYIRNLLKR